MPRNFLLILAALAPLSAALLPVSAASATRTAVSLTLTEPDGSTPMASAPVGIFYVQPSDYEQADGAAIHFTELGSGTTGADGSVAIALDTSVIAPANLADIGDLGCGHPTCVYQWNADYFSGNLSLWNPDCCIGRGSPIGNVQYPVPKFHPGPGNAYWFELTPHNSGWSRDSGARRQSTAGGTFTFPFASTIGSNSVTTYGSVTSVTYNWIRSGACTSSDTRVIWGYKTDPVAADIVQANCYPASML